MNGFEIFERFSKVCFISCKCEPRQGHGILIDAMTKLGYKAKLHKKGDVQVKIGRLIFHIVAVNNYRWFLAAVIYINGQRHWISHIHPQREYET